MMDTKLFNLLMDEELTLTERADILDYFMWKTLDSIREKNKEEAERLVELFNSFSSIVEKNLKEQNIVLVGFFFCLGQLLSLEFGIRLFDEEAIEREEFERSFDKLIKKYGV